MKLQKICYFLNEIDFWHEAYHVKLTMEENFIFTQDQEQKVVENIIFPCSIVEC